MTSPIGEEEGERGGGGGAGERERSQLTNNKIYFVSPAKNSAQYTDQTTWHLRTKLSSFTNLLIITLPDDR